MSLEIVYGNTDAGPGRPESVPLSAKLIEVEALGMFPLSRELSHLLQICPPNRWGLS